MMPDTEAKTALPGVTDEDPPAAASRREAWSDEKLMWRTQDGDREAFAVLYGRYCGKLCSYLDRMGKWVEDVEGVAQETFLQAFRYARTYRYPRKFADWFFTIARNLASRQRRAWCRGSIRSASDIDAELMDRQADPAWLAREQADLLETREAVALLRTAIERLPDYQRAVVVLGALEDKPYAQIERMTGVKAVTLRSHMFKGIRRLSSILQADLAE